MFKRILTPVDLAHLESLRKALDCTADLARHYGSPVVYVGVTSSGPTSLARNPEEFNDMLRSFVESEIEKHGIQADLRTCTTNDPTTEIDDALLDAISELEANLVVMASHVPGPIDHIWPSNGGKIARHAGCSVLIVR